MAGLTKDFVEPIGQIFTERLQVPLLLIHDARLIKFGQLRFRLRPANVWLIGRPIQQVQRAQTTASGSVSRTCSTTSSHWWPRPSRRCFSRSSLSVLTPKRHCLFLARKPLFVCVIDAAGTLASICSSHL